MKFISFPVLFNREKCGEYIMEETLTEFLDSGNYQLDYLNVNPNCIAAYNQSDDGRCSTLRLIGGETWNVLMPFKELEEILSKC